MQQPDLHDQILFVAETVGQLSERFDKIEREFTSQAAPLDASKGAMDGAVSALNAALTGIKALNFHVLDNNLGAVSKRVEEIASQADVALRNLESQMRGVATELKQTEQATAQRFEQTEAQRMELAAKREEDARTLAARVEELKQELATQRAALASELEASVKKFAQPATFNPRGKFDAQSEYARLDVVELNGSSFISTEDGNRDKPGKESKRWQMLARRGGSTMAGGVGNFDSLAGVAAVTQGGTGTTSLASAVQLFLDAISSTRGTVLYRGASGWTALAPGTSGHFLSTQGTGADPSWLAASGSGLGDFSGPASSTDNALVRFDGAGGKNGQNSSCTLSDAGDMIVAGTTNATSTTSGAFRVGSNVGLSGTAGGASYFGGALNLTGASSTHTIGDTANSFIRITGGGDTLTGYYASTNDLRYQLSPSAGGGGKAGLVLGNGAASGDVNIYRDSANNLKTDDTFTASGTGTHTFGTTNTVSMAAGVLTTTGNGVIGGDLTVSGGNVGVGVSINTAQALAVNSSALTGATQYGIVSESTFTSAATTSGTAGYFQNKTSAAAFTQTSGYAIQVATPTVGAASAITTQRGVEIANQGAAGITNAYGIDIAAQSGAATTNVGLRNAGTTLLTGAVGIGTTTLSNGHLTVSADSGNTVTLYKAGGSPSVAFGSSSGPTGTIESKSAGGINLYAASGTWGAPTLTSVFEVLGTSTATGNANVKYTTASTSTTTGALVVSGGVGIAGAVYAGAGGVNVTGNDPGNAFLSVNNTGSTSNRTFRLVAGVQGVSQNGFSIYDTVAAATRLTIDNSGNTALAGTVATTANVAWNLGAANVVSPTSPNRTITVTIDGTVYYLAAKTTND